MGSIRTTVFYWQCGCFAGVAYFVNDVKIVTKVRFTELLIINN
ncbi:hypothetical protein [Okeania sp. SIO2C9]|nr:hypothetical protein [Okeania sp. SIO2C9]